MRRTQEATTLTQLLTTAQASRQTHRRRTAAGRRAQVRLALTLGVMSSCVGLGLLVGELGRSLIGG
ncbi:hypothetical protein [Phenylobacterium sp.]|uniref:hypothetical protein n=1 Tax=Phenylobacterium sp. TaxID=1871053 RepID=UPI00271D315E|nr:hypothetical protein [Phenylobacterium sp.]MDO8380470.1 hypothetical protein [Phenylobacterium sp.]